MTIEQNLQSHLFRFDCPDPLILGEYHFGLLKAVAKRAVQDHLSICPLCRREIGQLAGFLTATADPLPQGKARQSLLERIKIFVVDILAPSDSELLPHAAYRDGDKQMFEQTQFRVHRAGRFLISLSLKQIAAGPQTIIGDIANIEEPANGFSDWAFHFWQDGVLKQVSPLDETGAFILEAADTNPFELILTGPEIEIHLQHGSHET
jgi:hypothetical protein